MVPESMMRERFCSGVMWASVALALLAASASALPDYGEATTVISLVLELAAWYI